MHARTYFYAIRTGSTSRVLPIRLRYRAPGSFIATDLLLSLHSPGHEVDRSDVRRAAARRTKAVPRTPWRLVARPD